MSKARREPQPIRAIMPEEDVIRRLRLNTDTNLIELSAFCDALRDKLAAELDSLIANCGGTLEQCYNAVRTRLDYRLGELTGQAVECRDSLRSQLYVRQDEYFIKVGYDLPGVLDEPRRDSQVQSDEPTEQKCYYGYCWELPVSTQHFTLYGCDATTGEAKEVDFWIMPSGEMVLIGRDGSLTPVARNFAAFDQNDAATRAMFGLGPVDPITGTYNCTAGNGGDDDAPPPIDCVKNPGDSRCPTLAGGQCDDSTLRAACERAGGKWFQGRCYFTPPIDTLDGGNGQGGNNPCPGGIVVVVDQFGGSCPADCLGDASDPSKVIIRLQGNARLWCGACPPGTFTIRDRRANATDNSCQAVCVESESSPGQAVLELPLGAELYCGPCGKTDDNPVGIEQPQAFRFQQRQSPWFREAINWSGQNNIDFYNSPTQDDYLDEGIRLRRSRNEG